MKQLFENSDIQKMEVKRIGAKFVTLYCETEGKPVFMSIKDWNLIQSKRRTLWILNTTCRLDNCGIERNYTYLNQVKRVYSGINLERDE